MADKIKKFWEKKKKEAKFRMAGPGHRLNETKAPQPVISGSVSVASRAPPSAESQQAAAAALARLSGNKTDTPAFNTSLAAIQAKVKRELEAEKKAASAATVTLKDNEGPSSPPIPDEVEASPVLAVRGVYFRCPMIGPDILTKEEWKVKIKEFLYEQLGEEKGLTACLIIHSCNKNKEKIQACIETLCKYLENIILHPDEEKYHRIRISNRVFQEKVVGMDGALEFLEAAGFRQQILPFQDGEQEFLVFSVEALEDLEALSVLIDALKTAEPIGLELDRNMQVLMPSQAAKRSELPPAFFSMTPEEIKREQQLKSERIENTMVLRTKTMREKEEQREMRKYRFAVIRIRFPDGILLQGTFGVYEHLSDVFEFVQEHVVSNEEFVLSTATGQRMTDDDGPKTLVELHLVPATILLFNWVTDLPEQAYLKPEVMLQLQSL